MANLLIVDDVEMDRLLETRIVEDAGHAPFFAKDGEDALRVYQENDIDVVITDLRMPNVDGLQLIQDLLAHDPRAAIIAVSGAADQLEKAEKCGAFAALEKPVVPEVLLETVHEILENLNKPLFGGDVWGGGR